MSKNKGKPSGKDAEKKGDVGRMGNYKRTGWPEDAPTQHVSDGTAQQPGNPLEPEEIRPGEGEGRHHSAGSPY